MKPATRGALVGTVAMVAAMWFASALGELIAGPTPTETSTGGSVSGEATEPPVVDDSPPTPGFGQPRVHAAKASRNRAVDLPRTGTLQLTDTTCYAATGNLTASGKTPQVGMAASNRYAFGTVLHVEGVGLVTVEDRIGHGSSLDIFGPSEAFCRDFGRRSLLVEVVG